MKTIQVPRRFVTHPWGGTETVVLETAKRMIAKGHSAPIWTSQAMSDQREETIEGVPVRRFPHIYPYVGLDDAAKRALDQKGGNLFSFALRNALLKEPELNLLHLHTGKRMGGIVRAVAEARNIPYVISLHGGLLDVPAEESRSWTAPTEGKFEWGKALGAWVGARRVVDDASAVLCLGTAEAEAVRKKYPGVRVEIVPNGVDPSMAAGGEGVRWRAENNVRPDERLLLIVGRIDPQKGQITAVQALQNLPGAVLALIGGVTNEPYFEEIQRCIVDLGLQDRVRLIPGYPRGDRRLWDAYAAADVVVLPSRHEPFGIVVLEAWSASKPVVTTNAGGLRDLVAEGKDGLVFPAGDAEALTVALSQVFRMPGSGLELGAAGCAKVRAAYTWDAITDRLLNLYKELIDARPVRS